MGLFTRTRDIVSANINSLLEKAEDPEKLIRQLIREMEDTAIELKASCAGALAAKKRVRQDLDACDRRIGFWGERAQLAVDRGRDNLARQAIREKRFYIERFAALENELDQCEHVIEQYQNDIQQLEDKLNTVREKQRVLVHRHRRAVQHKQVQTTLRKLDTSDTFRRIEQMECRIDRVESQGDVVNLGRRSPLESRFAELERDEEIEKELEELKRKSRESHHAATA